MTVVHWFILLNLILGTWQAIVAVRSFREPGLWQINLMCAVVAFVCAGALASVL